ncbi:FMN-dependent dehydrogenase-domain-containing protein [Aspergillus leporis]|uniref:FMN-dependent dehydrogenase-domain-containing protein n=1 Tax=Aspergillus leporis TaxID=41062 RepID=A0A5N5WJ90_9EURO|nr:FMN-dependent dehydrogenase-domain-containing protein [Aspergillus leporis]
MLTPTRCCSSTEDYWPSSSQQCNSSTPPAYFKRIHGFSPEKFVQVKSSTIYKLHRYSKGLYVQSSDYSDHSEIHHLPIQSFSTMCDPTNPNIQKRTTPQWALYQRENFWKLNEGKTPPFSTDPTKLEQLAHEKLSQGGWLYASSNAGISNTHLANRQAFFRHRIVPQQLVDTNLRDTTTEIFGHRVSGPIGFAPIGINKIYHPSAEAAVAKVADELNLPYCLSTAGSTPIERVAEANGKGPRFFQLYMPHDDELTLSLLNRAWKSGFDALILTTDTWQLGWRHGDVANSNYAFYRGIGADLGMTDPVFQKRCREAGIDPEKDVVAASAKWIDAVWHGRAWSWEKIPWLIEQWREISGGRPFAIKGIQSVADAKRCVEYGVDSIVVSNHAGRQVDGAIASLDALENITNAVGD